MAVVVDPQLKKLLADKLSETATLKIEIAYSDDGTGGQVTTSNGVTYNVASAASTNYFADISAQSPFTIGTGGTVNSVSLYDGTTLLVSETLTTDNTFPNGGDFIVTSYKVTVS